MPDLPSHLARVDLSKAQLRVLIWLYRFPDVHIWTNGHVMLMPWWANGDAYRHMNGCMKVLAGDDPLFDRDAPTERGTPRCGRNTFKVLKRLGLIDMETFNAIGRWSAGAYQLSDKGRRILQEIARRG